MSDDDAITYDQLLTRLIEDGIAEVTREYADPEKHHKRDGAIAGFEACRGKRPDEILALWKAAERECFALRQRVPAEPALAYWTKRYESLQYEWILNVISVGLVGQGKPALAPHLPTVRAATKYAEICGVDRGTSHGPDWDDRKGSP